MKNNRRSVSPLVGVLVCVVTWSVAPVAGAVTGEREGRVKSAPKSKAPPSALSEVAVPRAADETRGEEVAGCRRLSSARPLRLNLKPDTDILDLVAWMSSITCRQFVVPGTILANPKKVTVYAPELITAEGAYRLFLSALDSVGLTIQESGKFLRIIETAKAKNTALPLYGFEGQLLSNDAHRGSTRDQAPAAKTSVGEEGDGR